MGYSNGVALLALAAGSTAFSAQAQTSQDAAADAVDASTRASVVHDATDIVVTARKRDEAAQRVPISITAFSGEALERQGAKDFRDFALNNANVKIDQVSSQSLAVNISIRGNVQGSGTLAVDPSVGTYVDGHLISHTFGTISLSTDVSSVQTLKGPQGTLFGRNTTGGAMLISTNDPVLDEVTGYAQGEVGTVGTRRFGGAINLPLGSVAALRVVYQNNALGNFQSFTNGVELGERAGNVLRGKLLLQPTDTTEIIFTAERAREHANGAIDNPAVLNGDFSPRYKNVPITIYTPPSPNAPGQAPIDPRANRERSSFKSEFYGLRVTQDVGGNGTVKLIAGRRTYDIVTSQSLPPSLGFTRQNKPDNKDTSVELQYTDTLFDNRLDLAAGLFYFRETTHEDQSTFVYAGAQRTYRYLTSDQRSQSAYAQGTVHITDALNLTLGGRYTKDKKWAVLRSATRGAGGFLGDPASAFANPAATMSQRNSRFNYLITVDYSPVQDVLLYLTHSTGYRAGGSGVDRRRDTSASTAAANAANFADPMYRQAAEFGPESIKNYEGGFKTQFFDRMLTFNGAAFYQDYSSYQYAAIDPFTLSRVTLNVDATIKGFEFDAALRLRSGTSLSGSVGRVDARIADSSSPSDGARLQNVPDWTYSVSLSQNLQVSGGDLDLVANWSWRSAFSGAVDDPLAPGLEEAGSNVGSNGLLNLSATYKRGPYSLALFANNATNNKYFTYILYSGAGAINFGGLGQPRVVGLRGRVEF